MTRTDHRRLIVAIVLTAVAMALAPEIASAASPFGVARPEASVAVQSGPLAGMFAWIAAKQSAFYQGLSGLVTAFKTDGTAAWALIGLSFLYGLFHAAGPGHGKVVITSYLVATGETLRRGVVLAFMSAFAQAMTAIALVTVMTVLLSATSFAMTRATGLVEIASYALIALIGAALVYRKGAALLARVPVFGPQTAAAGGPAHGHVHVGQAHGHHHHDHAVARGHVHGPDCGHSHGPDPADLTGPFSLSRAWTAVLAVGLRPCSGAIIVLVFAFAQGVYGIGIAAALAMAAGTGMAVGLLAGIAVGAHGFAARMADSGNGWAAAGLQAAEFLAALAVFGFGLLLLGGALQGGI
ncbi:nickel/cobalt transporter [Microbaculum marinum]|uniref:Nickel/cobalt efflux system n=1 Tax=Microbaculum marinum TaxID=1764581 RepID=A0AAW9RVX8_9HYPH